MAAMPDTSPLDKAAILLLSMGEQAAARVLSKLSRDDVITLSGHMARLSGVSTEDARGVIQGFFDHFRSHSGISAASRDYLEKTLDLAVGKRLARGMIDGIYGDALREDMQKLQWVPAETLARFFRTEHPQMQAVLLAFLPPDTASAVLALMPEELHDDLLFRVANMKEVSDQVLDELKQTLDRCLVYVSQQSTAKVDGIRQAADILNCFSGDRASLMDMLRMHDEGIARSVTENMYDFATLGKQSREVLQVIVQEVPEESLALALKGAEPAVRDALTSALPKRMAQSISDRTRLLGLVPVSQVTGARREVMGLVRELHEQEVIQYQIFEEKVID